MLNEKYFWLLMDHPTNKAKSLKRFAESVKDRFRLFFLPPYSPELNPDERVWNDLVNNSTGRKFVTSPAQLCAAVINHLRFIQKSPDRARSYFQNETTRYAA